jgi:hypothetical protein
VNRDHCRNFPLGMHAFGKILPSPSTAETPEIFLYPLLRLVVRTLFGLVFGSNTNLLSARRLRFFFCTADERVFHRKPKFCRVLCQFREILSFRQRWRQSSSSTLLFCHALRCASSTGASPRWEIAKPRLIISFFALAFVGLLKPLPGASTPLC